MEENDPRLIELVILPMKTFGVSDIERLSVAIGKIYFLVCIVCVIR